MTGINANDIGDNAQVYPTLVAEESVKAHASTTDQEQLLVSITELTRPDPEWDEFVASHPFGDIVQSSLWALTKRAIGQTPVLVTLRNGNGAIVGGLMAVEYKFKRLIRVGIVSKGPLARDNDRETMATTVNALLASKWRKKLMGLIIQPPEGAEHFENVLEGLGFKHGALAIGIEATARVNLLRDEAEILAGFSSSGRRHVRKGATQGIVVEQSDHVEGFHRLYSASAMRKGFRPISLDYLKSQWELLSPGGHVAIMAAKYGGKTHAAIWLTIFGGTVTYKFPGWDSSLPSPKYLNEHLHWETMRWAKRNGARCYDFGGFNREAAENIANGLSMPPGFESTHNLFKYGFDPHPAIFPKAQFMVGTPGLNRLAAPLIKAVLGSAAVLKLARKLRG